MGGKGGGGGGVGGGVSDMVVVRDKDGSEHSAFAGDMGTTWTSDQEWIPMSQWQANGNKWKADEPAPAAAAETPKAEEPIVTTPDPTPTPYPTPTPDPTPTPTPTDPGGAPSGDVLGGSILNPPKYWVGGIDSYKKGPSTKSSSLTTTQT